MNNFLIPLPPDMSDLINFVLTYSLISSVSGARNKDSASVLAIVSPCNGANSWYDPSGSITSIPTPVTIVLTVPALKLRRIKVAYAPLQFIFCCSPKY